MGRQRGLLRVLRVRASESERARARVESAREDSRDRHRMADVSAPAPAAGGESSRDTGGRKDLGVAVHDAVSPEAFATVAKASVSSGTTKKGATKLSVEGGVSKAAVKGSSSVAAKSEKKRRSEIRRRIEHLRGLLPDSVRNKNVIEVLDDTILLINSLKQMLEAAQRGLVAPSYGPAFSMDQLHFLQQQRNLQLQFGGGAPSTSAPNQAPPNTSEVDLFLRKTPDANK